MTVFNIQLLQELKPGMVSYFEQVTPTVYGKYHQLKFTDITKYHPIGSKEKDIWEGFKVLTLDDIVKNDFPVSVRVNIIGVMMMQMVAQTQVKIGSRSGLCDPDKTRRSAVHHARHQSMRSSINQREFLFVARATLIMEYSCASFDDSRAVLMTDWFKENQDTPFHFKAKKIVRIVPELQGLTNEHVEFEGHLMKVVLLSVAYEDESCQSQVVGTFEDDSFNNSFDAMIPSFVLDFLPGLTSSTKKNQNDLFLEDPTPTLFFEVSTYSGNRLLQ